MTPYSCFISGTDTGVGKTLVTCAMLHALRVKGIQALGMKPVASGAAESAGRLINADTEAIMAASAQPLKPEQVTPCLFSLPTSPHLAARAENKAIQWESISDAYQQLRSLSASIIVEGIGGFRVLFSDSFDSADMAVQFGLPVILVVGLKLGAINHALLTAEAIQSRSLTLSGWVANQVDPDMTDADDYIATLEKHLPAPRLGTLPFDRAMTAAEAATCLDLSRLIK